MTLYDAYGRPVDHSALTRAHAGPSLTGVRALYTTHPASGLTPQRLASILREAEVPGHGSAERYLELAETMEERDLHYAGVLQTRRRQVAQIGVTVEPASDARADVRDADFVRSWFEREEVEDELVDMMDALGKSFSVAEIVWEHSARQWMPRRLVHRLPQWFDYDAETGTELRQRTDAGGWEPIAPWKFVVHTARAKSGLPIRGGLARIAAWAWLFKSLTWRDWVRFAEAYGQPIRIGRYHPTATRADKDTLTRAVRDVAADAAAILPDGMQIEFVGDTTVRGRSEIYRDLVTYIDAQISVAVLGQTLTTQAGAAGSYALGQVHNMVRADIERSDALQLAATLRRDLVRPMVELNYGPRPQLPRVVIRREDPRDMKMIVDAVERLTPLGLTIRTDDVRALLGFEAPKPQDDVLAPSAERDPDETPPEPSAPAAARDAERAEIAARHDAPNAADDWEKGLDALLDSAADPDRIEPVATDLAGAFLSAVQSDPDVASARLAERYPDIDARGLEQLLGRVIFLARTWGQLAADDEDA